MNKKLLIPSLAVLTIVIGAAFAALLFTQTFPPVTRPSPIVSNCTTLNPVSPPPVGTAGTFKFDCNNTAAFSIPGGQSTPPVSPFFVLPAGYTSLAVVLHTDPCTVNPHTLTSNGGPYNFAGGTDWDYCASVDSSTQNLATFNVQWNI